MEYNIPISKQNLHKAMLNVVNFSLGLSETEIDIVATLLANNLHIVDTKARDVLRKELNKTKFSTNNYIGRLKDKNIIIQDPSTKKLYINSNLINLTKTNKITFNFDITN